VTRALGGLPFHRAFISLPDTIVLLGCGLVPEQPCGEAAQQNYRAVSS
jgi:hypothetical protein